MSKKLYGLLLPVLAVAAFAATASAAQAAPQWFTCKNLGTGHKYASESNCYKGVVSSGVWERVLVGGSGAKVNVTTSGQLTLTASNGLEVTCTVTDAGKIWNEGGQGKDEITSFVNSPCSSPDCASPTITANGLPGTPWLSHLEAGPVDVIEKLSVTVNCGGTATFTGNLSPAISESNGTATFNGATSGELIGPGEVTGTVTGTDAVKAGTETVGVE